MIEIREQTIKILHVAPEHQLQRFLSGLKNLDYVTADISRHDVMVQMDLTGIQYHDDCFDGMICNHVLEHIVDDRRAMRELFRVLKPGGWAILQVPISRRLTETLEDHSIVSEADRERVFGQKDHVRIYGADYTERLQGVGFEVKVFKWREVDHLGRFGGDQNRYALLQDENLFIAVKPA